MSGTGAQTVEGGKKIMLRPGPLGVQYAGPATTFHATCVVSTVPRHLAVGTKSEVGAR